MFMRLIRQQDRERLGISLKHIEEPFFAKHKVEEALRSPYAVLNTFDIKSFGLPLTDQAIVDAVEAGDLLLVLQDPFSPLSQDTFNE